jgi:hypothetical protein
MDSNTYIEKEIFKKYSKPFEDLNDLEKLKYKVFYTCVAVEDTSDVLLYCDLDKFNEEKLEIILNLLQKCNDILDEIEELT